MECCDMRGFLSYLILWMLSRKNMKGSEIAEDIKARKGNRPSPGTIYPALKELKKKGLIAADNSKRYSLTSKGKKELNSACASFCRMFFDMKDMASCCCK
jgi:DNA-binding PadR family transcriptional regulator